MFFFFKLVLLIYLFFLFPFRAAPASHSVTLKWRGRKQAWSRKSLFKFFFFKSRFILFKMIHPFRKLKRTIYLEGFEFILKVEKGPYKSQLNEKINTFSRDCQYYFLIFRTFKFRNNDRCTRSHLFFLIPVFFSVRTKLQTEVMAARLEARNLHLPHQACRSFSDYFYALSSL